MLRAPKVGFGRHFWWLRRPYVLHASNLWFELFVNTRKHMAWFSLRDVDRFKFVYVGWNGFLPWVVVLTMNHKIELGWPND